MSEKFAFRTLLAALALLLAAIYAIAVTPDNGRIAKGSRPEASSDRISRFKWLNAPRALPDTPFEDAEGHPVHFADFAGKVVLVNLWATWCAPCIEEMPSLAQLQEHVGRGDFEIVAISQDRKAEDAREWIGANGLAALALYHDPGNDLLDTLKAPGLPTSILIDREGREVGRLEGPADWSSDSAKALIAKVLGPAVVN